MTLPDAVQTVLDDEPVLDRLPLGGEDALFVTPARLVRYRADGLFSDESAEEFPHDAERVSVSRGRRTVEISIEYVDDDRSLSVPVDRFEAALQALLAGSSLPPAAGSGSRSATTGHARSRRASARRSASTTASARSTNSPTRREGPTSTRRRRSLVP
ncbi:DUF7115 domain-containing protein [Halalkalicoccus salilacus]|uniref:DUF7115 domain-containing protein n=1 Tax=Halalkalicoccus sp. GCM10025704 TaxID=3252662 RepID=UPI00361E6F02